MKTHKVLKVFQHDSPLAKALENYEQRYVQVQMAEWVLRTLEEGGITVIEGGTGTGKTLAYLVPLILEQVPAIISTGTIALQEQLLNKDIPLFERFNRSANAVVLKGRRNYACLLKAEKNLKQLPLDPRLSDTIEVYRHWLKTTATGDLGDLPADLYEPQIWNMIKADAETCSGPRCQYYRDCFLYNARRLAEKADLVIVNHHLLLSDLFLRLHRDSSLLPNHPCLIIDEAHLLEDAAQSCFSYSVNFRDINRFLDHLMERLREQAPHLSSDTIQIWQRDIETIRQIARTIFSRPWPDDTERLQWPTLNQTLSLAEELIELKEQLTHLQTRLRHLTLEETEQNLIERWLENLLIAISFFTEESEYVKNWILYGEHVSDYSEPFSWSLMATPLEIRDLLSDLLWHQYDQIILFSATLRVNHDFSYALQRLGLTELDVRTAAFDSPFNWEDQCRLWIPDDLPEPGHPEYLKNMLPRLRDLIDLVGGKTLVLCTSYRLVYIIADFLTEQSGYPILVQGQASKKELLQRFQRDVESVLVATTSFWQGVDIPGESLSCLVIDKIPFDVPSDPIIEAQIQRYREEGHNPFKSFQLPRAILMLRQGLGRLIRNHDDRGIMALFDSRVWKRSYGRQIRHALKSYPIVRSFKEVELFWNDLLERKM